MADVSENTDEKENDYMCSEAKFQFIIENFSKIKDKTISQPHYIRNLPWRIMIIIKNQPNNDRNNLVHNNNNKAIGIFLQCNDESTANNWSCSASAELKILSNDSEQSGIAKTIKHVFYTKENDWGYSNFITYDDLLDPKKCLVSNDTVTIEAHVVAEAPHGVCWDSKKYSGYVGLKNQGATCYMNSLLQTLFFTNQLRCAVYRIPTEDDDSLTSMPLALQNVFSDLQFTDKPVCTKKLTRSFGWDTADSFMQHDVQEFLRVILDKLEFKMKDTLLEGTIPNLFEGKMSSYIQCTNVNYSSHRTETFYDIQLKVKGINNINESFKDYIAKETLEGNNKYDAGTHGLQEAEKGVIFLTFPPVLHLHLMRFQYDPITDSSIKFNDRFEFDETLNLDEYLKEKESTPADYTLHAVLVHAGDNQAGHYVVYINPTGDGKWCKFDDDVVSRCSKNEAIIHNYGGMDDSLYSSIKQPSSAYMLIYIRNSELTNVLRKINSEDLPDELLKRLEEDKRIEKIQDYNSDWNNFVLVKVILEEQFEQCKNVDLFDTDKGEFKNFFINKTSTTSDLMTMLINTFKTPLERMRIWPFVQRHGKNRQFSVFNIVESWLKPISVCSHTQSPWTIFLELLPPDIPIEKQIKFVKDRDIFLFLKCYNPIAKQLDYCGIGFYDMDTRYSDILDDLNLRVNYSKDTLLNLYREIDARSVEKVVNLNDTIDKGWRHFTHGSVLIFERIIDDNSLPLPTCETYFTYLRNRIEVIFVDKTNPIDPGFTLELCQKMMYNQIAKAVSEKINVDPCHIQFFTCQTFRDILGSNINCTSDRTLEDWFHIKKTKSKRKLFYQVYPINIRELENKIQFKCFWLSLDMKETKELTVILNKNDRVKDLLEEAKNQIKFSEKSTGRLRLLKICSNKIETGPSEDDTIESLQSSLSSCIYRIEEVPEDQLNLTKNELLVSVAHFSKSPNNIFGTPFFMKIISNEHIDDLKKRIQIKLDVSNKDFEGYNFALVGIIDKMFYLEATYFTNLDDFISICDNMFPFLGIDHKNQRKTRNSCNEKSIKIYN